MNNNKVHMWLSHFDLERLRQGLQATLRDMRQLSERPDAAHLSHSPETKAEAEAVRDLLQRLGVG